MNILIRDVADALVVRMDAIAKAQGLSRQEFLTELLAVTYGEPPVVVGWFKPDRPGELDSDAECPECFQPMPEPWIAFLSNGRWHGPVCHRCATSRE